MAWKKSPPALVASFADLVAPFRDAERRSMFGYPAAFVKGNMFAGLHEDRLVLRLDDAMAAAAKQRGARDFEPMPGRTMKGWVAVPHTLVEDRAVPTWLERAHQHARTMKAKTRKKARKPKPRTRHS